MQTRIIVVDDHRMMRQGLRALLQREADFEVVGEADEGRAAIEQVRELLPDVVVMDLRMPTLNGIEATRQALAEKSDLKVIGLSGHSDEQSIREMLRAGAAGYLLKDAAFEELVTAIRSIMKGKVYLSPAISRTLVEDYTRGAAPAGMSAFETLSSREREVLQLLAEGQATKEVAAHLHVSVKTVETHRRNMMEKIQVFSVAELTKYAIREGITCP